MKNLFRAIIFLTMGLLFIACGQVVQITPSSGTTPFPTVTPDPSQTTTVLIESTPTKFDPMSIPFSTPSFPDGTNVPFPTPNPKIPTLLPTIDPKLIPDLLRKTISVQTLKGVNGHNTQKITGWDYGFRHKCNGYQWLDMNHLIMFPTTGQRKAEGVGMLDEASSVVINLDTEIKWVPNFKPALGYCSNWVPGPTEYGTLALPDFISGQDGVSVHTLDGDIIQTYPGKLISVSPSGTKILTENNTWIDLVTGKTVNFSWSEDTYPYDTLASLAVVQPVWSSDEKQVFVCCYHYGDARTGRSLDFPFYNVFSGTWVLNDSYVLLQWHSYWGGNPGFIPLYDPATNTLLNLNELAGIPTKWNNEVPFCQYTTAAPNGRYVWAGCQKTNYLVDLSNYQFASYPGEVLEYNWSELHWSADGKYAWLGTSDPNDYALQVLSGADKTLTQFPVYQNLDTSPSWHPTNHILAYLAAEDQSLVTLNVEDMSTQRWMSSSNFTDLFWNPNGDRIAFLATDGSLWQVNYPKLDNLEQLTPALPNVTQVNWSPDGNSIAFISGADIYIVDTTK